MGKVEAQPVGGVERPALRDMVAKRAAQRLVQQVRRGMVGADGRAPVVVDDQQPGFSGVVAKPYRIQEMGGQLKSLIQ